MGFDWEKEAESSGGTRAEKFKSGIHYCKVVRLMFVGKAPERAPLRSKKGDPQFRAVWRSCGMEGLDTFTCTAKAGFKIARALSRTGNDFAAIKERKLEPSDFADPEIVTPLLLDKWSWCRVERNGPHADFTPLKGEEVVKQIGVEAARQLKEQALEADTDDAEAEAVRDEARGDVERDGEIPF
jgi:hypothetical protein